MDPQFDRRDVAWIATLRRVLDDEPCPTVLAGTLSSMQAAGISLSYDAIRSYRMTERCCFHLKTGCFFLLARATLA